MSGSEENRTPVRNIGGVTYMAFRVIHQDSFILAYIDVSRNRFTNISRNNIVLDERWENDHISLD